MAHCSRKRPRSCEEECCELMPISKRINDLHIRSVCPESSTPLNNMPEMHPRIRNAREMQMYIAELQRQSMEGKDPNMVCNYRPELSAVENPYYYHMNEVLYEAHLQRMQRLSKPII